jgi:hypothetical protein
MTTSAAANLLRLVNGYQLSQAIHVAATLNLADHIGSSTRSSDELASLTRAHPQSLYRLLRALAAAGVLHEGDDRTFSLTDMGECLRSESVTPVGGWAAFIGRPNVWQAWGHLLHSVRTGENAYQDLHGQSVWQFRADHPEENAIFDRAMTSNSRAAIDEAIAAYDFGQFGHVADIGGGQGRLIAGILLTHPNLRGTLFDQPHVVAKAGDVLAAGGVADRCNVVAGNFFDAVPEGADAYIMRAVIHDWDDEKSLAILRTCRRAMRHGARLLLLERVVEPPNKGLITKLSDLNMLIAPGGQERSYDEYAALCQQTSFEPRGVVRAGAQFQIIEAVAN